MDSGNMKGAAARLGGIFSYWFVFGRALLG